MDKYSDKKMPKKERKKGKGLKQRKAKDVAEGWQKTTRKERKKKQRKKIKTKKQKKKQN